MDTQKLVEVEILGSFNTMRITTTLMCQLLNNIGIGTVLMKRVDGFVKVSNFTLKLGNRVFLVNQLVEYVLF